MKIAIVADDLTGASDCGGQLVRYGIRVSVQINPVMAEESNYDAVVFNTVSRSLPANEAALIVKQVSQYINEQPFDLIYKKIDSTLRGNIGAELNAMSDVIQPDFMIIAPGYPQNGRQIIERIHHLNGELLHETEVSRDPKTPVLQSDVVELVASQTGRAVAHLSKADIDRGKAHLADRLEVYKVQNMTYIVADSIIEEDLERLANALAQLPYKYVWVGSAGLMNHLPKAFAIAENDKPQHIPLPVRNDPVLLVVGSVSKMGREQLHSLMNQELAVQIMARSEKLLADEAGKQLELDRVIDAASRALATGRHTVIVASDNVAETKAVGQLLGMTPIQISDAISAALGSITVKLFGGLAIHKLFLTGGDTAYQVLEQLGITAFELMEELEPGVLLGKYEARSLYIVTKAGNFGSDQTMERVIKKLHGGECI
ncbi:Uncharacterized conserved protein YgbK, DUF1537 family [Paenibacillus algorifonticola]|uniref:Uncharacterized conserved protein YgbK, DUF1537 family n=1 Tax=Paenibacillus algorifonticola TaxID=684063 RepID=A0A1I1YP67_9BACL|nr:four-carbon acid sugar kinase family protein [Paenibacillus algorifonticola]SFE20828.1 Uncharacterized conserved protein YgbK, DUF1537 family [Paenibacillus algorifonticola]